LIFEKDGESLCKTKGLTAGLFFYKKRGGEGVEVTVPAYLFTGNDVLVGLERFDPNTSDLHNVLSDVNFNISL
jgi:hypothetical protein